MKIKINGLCYLSRIIETQVQNDVSRKLLNLFDSSEFDLYKVREQVFYQLKWKNNEND